MYHPINRIDGFVPLQRLNALARLTIEFGLIQQSTQPAPTVKTQFLAHFVAAGYPNAGEWLWNKPKKIQIPLMGLLKLPLANKQRLLSDYDSDVDFNRSFVNPAFALPAVRRGYKAALKLVNRLLANFYTAILAGDGVPADVLNWTVKLTRQEVLRNYLDTQDRVRVCPGCDGSPPEVEADGTINADVDHFFPKSIFPGLSIHALNLTPLCKYCNQSFKGDKNPLTWADKTQAGLPDIGHPYLAPLRDDTNVTVVRAADGKPHVQLAATSPSKASRLRSLNELLEIESRWDGALQEDYAKAPFVNQLRSACRGYAGVVTEAWLRAKLVSGVIPTIAEGIGELPRYVAAHAYAQWVANDPTELSLWTTFAQTYIAGSGVVP